MPSTQDTRTRIIRAAIIVLKNVGTEGLTLRRVAAQAKISLGNLQYHYTNRSALMAGLAEHYFDECARMLDGYRHSPQRGSRMAKLRHLILFLLDHVDHVSDMCRIFREIWALSTRDHDIHSQLMSYYELSMEKLSNLLLPICDSEEVARKMASLLVPYLEGYSITHDALPLGKKETAEMLVRRCRATE